jgi:biotin carboxylase
MEKKPIVIIECISTSVNYIHDIIEEGYEPVLMELPVPVEQQAMSRLFHDFCLKDLYLNLYPGAKPPRILQASEDYEETLELVRKLDPVLVLPGGDDGVILATRLAHDLKLVSNDPRNLPKMRNKDVAQEMLKQNGVRSIRGISTTDLDEALQFYHSIEDGRIVVKPNVGGASVGVFICDDEETLRKAFERDLSETHEGNGDSAAVLLEEYIGGTEYFVNTVSCRGVHKVTGIMVEVKKQVPGGAPIYYSCDTVSPFSEAGKQLTDYAFKVLDAIGIEYGPVHSEFKIDEKGPVLIEANCRLCGTMMPAFYQDKIFGERESRVSLRSYLHPEQFLADPRSVLMDSEYKGIIRILRINEERFVKRNKAGEVFRDLEGFEAAFGMGDNHLYPKTIDLSTASGLIFLAHKNRESLKHTLEIIDRIEAEEPERIYECI